MLPSFARTLHSSTDSSHWLLPLALQGIGKVELDLCSVDVHKLTQSQVQDLAGNAFSLNLFQTILVGVLLHY